MQIPPSITIYFTKANFQLIFTEESSNNGVSEAIIVSNIENINLFYEKIEFYISASKYYAFLMEL